MSSGNKIKDTVELIREYYKKNGKYPKGSFTITKNNAFRASKSGKIKID
jgi:hypothetical protein